MRTYESIFIVHPEATGDDLTAVIDKYKKILADEGAQVLKVDIWGTRTLAYPVKKQNKGSYVLVIFESEPNIIKEYERRMRIDDNVIKFQTVLLEDGYEATPEVPVANSEPAAEEEENAEA